MPDVPSLPFLPEVAVQARLVYFFQDFFRGSYLVGAHHQKPPPAFFVFGRKYAVAGEKAEKRALVEKGLRKFVQIAYMPVFPIRPSAGELEVVFVSPAVLLHGVGIVPRVPAVAYHKDLDEVEKPHSVGEGSRLIPVYLVEGVLQSDVPFFQLTVHERQAVYKDCDVVPAYLFSVCSPICELVDYLA